MYENFFRILYTLRFSRSRRWWPLQPPVGCSTQDIVNDNLEEKKTTKKLNNDSGPFRERHNGADEMDRSKGKGKDEQWKKLRAPQEGGRKEGNDVTIHEDER